MNKLPITPSLPRGDSTRRLLQACAILFMCLLSFALVVLYMKRHGFYSTDYSPDEGHYIAMAKRILSEHVYSYWGEGPDAYVSYGYHLFLVLGMAVFGSDLDGLLCIKLVQCAMLAGTVLLTYLLGKMLTGKFSVGFIACTLIALNPVYYTYCTRLLTEGPYFFFMMLFFVSFLWANQGEKPWRYVLSGGLFALTVMIRPLLVIILPFLFLPSLVENWRQKQKFLTPFLLFLAGFVVLCLPWWIRNLVTLHKVVILATQTNPIYAGLAPDLTGLEDPGSFLGNLKLMFQLLLKDPLGMVYWMTFGKFYIMFMQDVGSNFTALFTIIWNVTVYLGIFGALRALFSRRYWGASLTFFVSLAASFLFIPVNRYALQYMPMLAIFTGHLLVSAFSYQEETRRLL